MSFFLNASALALLVTLGYAAVCSVSPYRNCRKCRGFGFKTKTTRITKRLKRGKDCRRCHGHGIRIRRGRHWWNLARRLHRRGTPDAAQTAARNAAQRSPR
ncbi:hypothetical protein G5C51_08155 [Streptomyces sp. A7024]|uniref:Uncharacterized protein n=1 Tax=Streptomyces coryli TaxID=1128680 RepID=A0A6G4TV39_9ACTN|nr:hypothetical protein [Streptomyces coryli]NGN63879.1 hypothetical protein [Streptomyces coryli]